MAERKILLVDDEDLILRAFSNKLTKDGYTVETAASAEEALEILPGNYFQVMFLDLNLPNMTGVQLCREIRKDMPVPIIYAVTGCCSLFEVADCRDAGFDDLFEKPIDTNTLAKAAKDGFDRVESWWST